MAIGEAFDARYKLVDARVVFHGARAQRIHSKIDGVIPRREPREVTDDFDLADFGHVAEILALLLAEQLRCVNLRDIERRQLPRRFAGRRLFENQSFVLADVTRRFASHALRRHRATSSGSASFLRTERSLSATRPTAVSIMERVVNSVQHHRAALPSSG